jgi:hypothetical protein
MCRLEASLRGAAYQPGRDPSSTRSAVERGTPAPRYRFHRRRPAGIRSQASESSGAAGVPDAARGDAFHPVRRTSMRMLTILIAALAVISLTGCGGSDDGSGQPRRGQSGPYISGGGGVGF